MALQKVRVQLLDAESGEVQEEVDVLTSADAVTFDDGETFQNKLDAGKLKGPAGSKGADGATWLSGSGAPGNSSGKDGDFYLDLSTYDVYQKTSGAWGKKGNIKGATGAKGETGAQGPQGEKGAQGAQGPAGKDGAQGPAGADGEDGKDGATWLSGSSAPSSGTGKTGDYYLNTSNYDVYSKASGSWAKIGNIKGAQGAQGPQGPAGEDGSQGPAGPAGADGQDGAQGPKGDPGADGKDGTTPTIGSNGNWYLGSQDTGKPSRGATGPQGPKGETGATGAQGPQGPQGPAGKDGDSIKVGTSYESASTAKLFLKVVN